MSTSEGVRLQKVLAAAGVASRRACRGADQRGPGRGERPGGHRAGPADRSGVATWSGSTAPGSRRRGGTSTWCSTSRAAWSPLSTTRRAGATLAEFVAAPAGAAVPRRSAGHRHRGPADLDQRRGLRRTGWRTRPTRCRRPTWPRWPASSRRPRSRGCGPGVAARGRPGPADRGQAGLDRRRRRRRPGAAHRDTRAGTGSCAVRWRRSGTRYDGCRGRHRSGPAGHPAGGRDARADSRRAGRAAGPDQRPTRARATPSTTE